MKESIANRVQALRGAAGITQQDLAEAAGVTRQTIIAVEKGNYIPSLLLAMKIAQYFKKSVEELFHISYER